MTDTLPPLRLFDEDLEAYLRSWVPVEDLSRRLRDINRIAEDHVAGDLL